MDYKPIATAATPTRATTTKLLFSIDAAPMKFGSWVGVDSAAVVRVERVTLLLRDEEEERVSVEVAVASTTVLVMVVVCCRVVVVVGSAARTAGVKRTASVRRLVAKRMLTGVAWRVEEVGTGLFRTPRYPRKVARRETRLRIFDRLN